MKIIKTILFSLFLCNPIFSQNLEKGDLKIAKNGHSMSFEPPAKGIENNRVLILDESIGTSENNSQRANSKKSDTTAGLWDRFELIFKNDRVYKNPFAEVELLAEFTSPDGRKVETWGFYDNSNTWRLRFMPDQIGKWKYVAWFTDQTKQKISGTFQCVPSDIPGLISADETNPTWFGFKGGKHVFIRSFHVGDRFFASNWSDEKRKEFLDWAGQNKYNTLSIASHYLNRDGQDRGRGWETPMLWNSEKQQPDPHEFAEMESLLDDLASRKMIIFPFGGFFGQNSNYPRESNNQLIYIRYTIARLGSYWNLLYNVSGPEPLLQKLKEFSMDQIDSWGKTIASLNTGNHLITVHNPGGQNPFINATWASYQCLQGPKTVDLHELYSGLMALRNPKQPLYAQETLWYGNIYHHQEIGHEYSDADLNRNAWIIAMAGAALNFADNNGNSSTGFSGTLDLNERHQDKHDIIIKIWDFIESIPYYKLSPSPDLVDNGFCLAKPGDTYLIYLPSGGNVTVNILPKHYQGEWINGSDTKIRIPVEVKNGKNLQSPAGENWLLYLTKSDQP